MQAPNVSILLSRQLLIDDSYRSRVASRAAILNGFEETIAHDSFPNGGKELFIDLYHVNYSNEKEFNVGRSGKHSDEHEITTMAIDTPRCHNIQLPILA